MALFIMQAAAFIAVLLVMLSLRDKITFVEARWRTVFAVAVALLCSLSVGTHGDGGVVDVIFSAFEALAMVLFAALIVLGVLWCVWFFWARHRGVEPKHPQPGLHARQAARRPR